MNPSRRVSKVVLGLILSLLALLLLQSFMSSASTQTVLLGVIAGLMAVLAVQPGGSKHVQYRLVPTESLDQPALEQLGQEGWELVCSDEAGRNYVFRR